MSREILAPFVESLRSAAVCAHHDVSPSALCRVDLRSSGAVMVPDGVTCVLHELVLDDILYKGFGEEVGVTSSVCDLIEELPML